MSIERTYRRMNKALRLATSGEADSVLAAVLPNPPYDLAHVVARQGVAGTSTSSDTRQMFYDKHL